MLIGVTQRVDEINGYGERRDSLDQEWIKLLDQIGLLPVPLPNSLTHNTKQYLKRLNLDGVLLTGGNDIISQVNDPSNPAQERDLFEECLFYHALDNGLPIFAICRGMQFVNCLLGGHLSPIKGHVATRHKLTNTSSTMMLPNEVNSYHSYCIKLDDLGSELQAIGLSDGDTVEAFTANNHKILGIMWHPEREKPYNQIDINLIKAFFND